MVHVGLYVVVLKRLNNFSHLLAFLFYLMYQRYQLRLMVFSFTVNLICNLIWCKWILFHKWKWYQLLLIKHWSKLKYYWTICSLYSHLHEVRLWYIYMYYIYNILIYIICSLWYFWFCIREIKTYLQHVMF